MFRSPSLAAPMLILALLGGCGGTATSPAANDMAAGETMDNMTMDVSPDSLAAPSDMPVDSESNAAGSASGGNAM